jgi:hypothetical protein
MDQTIEGKNKTVALQAFDTPFNERDYAAAGRYWSPNSVLRYLPIRPDNGRRLLPTGVAQGVSRLTLTVVS